MKLPFSLALVTSVVCVALGGKHEEAAEVKNVGTVDAVNDLLDRVLPGAKDHFSFVITQNKVATAMLEDMDGKIKITGSSASELTLGLGHYMREYCNMTIGWKRGGGSNVFIPKEWPTVGTDGVKLTRSTPWSYIMNVCTHSYSLVWYSWNDWQEFIDWMSLSGINLYLAMTGQEEVQYKVFEKFGLNDTTIRTWFNGPAFLTWSRGQNEYGNDIAGTLPRSWMQSQWAMQKNILARTRGLGMSGQLPAFQGNVPLALKEIHKDMNITKQGDTGWMTSTDPLFGQIADEWMKTLIADFGTDHWYQLDGYFNGGTAPWLENDVTESVTSSIYDAAPLPACTWSPLKNNTYVAGCDAGCKSYKTASMAQAACVSDSSCGGITLSDGAWQLRSGDTPLPSPIHEQSYYITNANACHGLVTDPGWVERGAAAYMGLNRTDPDAIWSFQGWAFVGWSGNQKGGYLKSFIDATPQGKFNVIDMSVNGEGEWKKWNNCSFWGANFVWTTLHDFGGTDGLKGDLARINRIPFDAMVPQTPKPTNVWGTGFTPEGIDQNPVYYEFMLEANYRDAPVTNITDHVVLRSHRRYGLTEPNPQVTEAWSLLVASAYSQDLSVQDGTGVAHIGANEGWAWASDLHTPSPTLCNIYTAWKDLVQVGTDFPQTAKLEPFNYDLVNTGREILAQLAGPSGKNFTNAIGQKKMDAALVKSTGEYYAQVLMDIDTLVATDSAFLIGPWIEMARYFGADADDCDAGPHYPTVKSCPDFYEWNARVQLTTWNPTPLNATKIPGGPIDYASKHWSGLISGYYAKRVNLITSQALADAAAGKPLDSTAVTAIKAKHAYDWTTATDKFPTAPVGNALQVSKSMMEKYAPFFATCGTN